MLARLFDGATAFGAVALVTLHVHLWWHGRRVRALELAHRGTAAHAAHLSQREREARP